MGSWAHPFLQCSSPEEARRAVALPSSEYGGSQPGWRHCFMENNPLPRREVAEALNSIFCLFRVPRAPQAGPGRAAPAPPLCAGAARGPPGAWPFEKRGMAAPARDGDMDMDRPRDRDPAWPQGGRDVSVLTLLSLRNQMKQKLKEYSAALHGGQANVLDHGDEEKLIQSATEYLQSNIEEAEVSFWNKTLALQRIQLTSALRNKAHQDDKDSRLILETVKCIVLLGQTIMKYQQQVHEKEQQLTDIKRKRLLLKEEEGQKLQQIQTMKKKQNEKPGYMNPAETKMLHKFEKEKEMTTVIQNVFQNIVIGSEVNWAEDPSLKKIFLQLEKNVQLQ
ncbi:centromere protein H [Pithys albifrons albifrons]|uniref:centromere protein H n=1 Tax=Pithys albifrons albifrons TaxID=3385563 RepID=UPI003A5CCF5B